MKNFIGDLGIVPAIKEAMEIFCDSEGAVSLTKEPRDHGRSRHIDRKYHFIKHRVEEGHLVLKRVSSEENHVDPLTKGLNRVKHIQHDSIIHSFCSYCKSGIFGPLGDLVLTYSVGPSQDIINVFN